MDRLPFEVMAEIVAHLAVADGPRPKPRFNYVPPLPLVLVASYATISRRWQAAVEARTFAELTLTPERIASPVADQALTPNRFRRLVRFVHAKVVLPQHGEAAWLRPENEEEQAANDVVFTDFCRKLFALLSSASGSPLQQARVEPATGTDHDRPWINLSLEAVCPSDTDTLTSWRRFRGSYLDLRPLTPGKTLQDEAGTLAELHSITTFRVWPGLPMMAHLRQFAPRAACLLASIENAGVGGGGMDPLRR